MKFLLFFIALSAYGQFGAAKAVINGTGAPNAAQCTNINNVGKVYARKDGAAANTTFYVCSNTAASTYAWELLGSGGGGAVSSVTAGATGAVVVTPTTGAVVVDIDTAYVPSKTNLYAVTGRGAFASLPTCNSTAAVRAYFFTDSFYDVAHCDGSSWVYLRNGQSYTQPTGLSATSGTTATTSTTNGGTTVSILNTVRVEAFTAASNFSGATKTVTSCWMPTLNLTGVSYEVGIVLRESATSKHVIWTTFVEANRMKMNRAYWTNASTWSSNGVIDSGYMPGTLVCARVRKASSNLYFEIAPDGVNYITLNSTTLTAFFTTDADEAGIGGVANGTLVPIYGSFLHFAVN